MAEQPRGAQRDVVAGDAACLSVDAGAGTGKTTTLLMRLERAIDEGRVEPEDVLVLTFANEAAASIRTAVAERLSPERAAAIEVSTYHSFCHRLVREYAYALGYSPEFEVVTDQRRRRIVARLLESTDYGFATAEVGDQTRDLVGEVDAFIARMSREDLTPADLDDRLPAVRTLECCTEFVYWLERCAEETLSFENEALRYFNRDAHLAAAREALVGYGKRLEFCRETIAESPPEFREDPFVGHVEAYLRVLQQCVTQTIETLSLDEPITKQLPRALFGNQISGRSTGRLEQSPFGRLKHTLEFLRVARHYADVYADYHAWLATEGALDFDELVRTATDLVAGAGDGAAAEIATAITSEWAQVYCDEFQDTDETQFALIEALTAGPDRPDLLAIGDVDQAIYGWRGTDRKGLARLATVHDDHASVELGLNFRSRQEILDLTNACRYDGQSTKTLREADREPGSVWRTDEEPADGGPPDRVLKVESDELSASSAEQVATVISRLLNGRAANVPRRSLADLAVIVRTNDQARRVAEALQDRQIPHERSGSARGALSPGIRTVLSYLRVIADPDADVHLRRVLLARYRISRADLSRLARDDRLSEALLDAAPDDFDSPDRIATAQADLEALTSLSRRTSVSVFLDRFFERTSLAWFLTDDERTDLDRLHRVATAYGGESVLETLTPGLVDALERALAGGERGRSQGTSSPDSVDVMTVHQAKGLEFDTVLVPYLSDEEWVVDRDYAERARYRLLAATLSASVDSPFTADLAAESVAEEWRVLHVALTRAENHLVVFGSEYDYEGDDSELGASTAQACCAPAIEWSVCGRRMDLWATLCESFDRVQARYPETVADRTAAVDAATDETPGTITYYDGYADRAFDPLESREAIATVNRLGRLLRRGTLLAAADAVDHLEDAAIDDGAGARRRVPTGRSPSALTADTVRFPTDALGSDREAPVRRIHSYTAVDTYETCPRKHYLDHVVRATDDPEPPSGDATAAAAPTAARVVGTVFHDVAEEAFARGLESRAAWQAVANRQLTARSLTAHRERLLGCIDRFFDATAEGIDRPVAAWEQLAAERPIRLADGTAVDGEVVGAVDAINRLPAGTRFGDGLAILDYKTTAEPIAAGEAIQLAIYVRACRQAFDEPIAAAGYVYVGQAGPRVDLFAPDDLPDWTTVSDRLAALETSSYEETTPGPHCQFCPHRSLGCAPAEYASRSSE